MVINLFFFPPLTLLNTPLKIYQSSSKSYRINSTSLHWFNTTFLLFWNYHSLKSKIKVLFKRLQDPLYPKFKKLSLKNHQTLFVFAWLCLQPIQIKWVCLVAQKSKWVCLQPAKIKWVYPKPEKLRGCVSNRDCN